MNRRVSVWKYVRLKNGRWRYCKPAVAKNGKIKADWVIVKGKHQRHLEGTFYLHRYDRNKEIWRKIGPQSAGGARRRRVRDDIPAKGVPVKPLDFSQSQHRSGFTRMA